MNRYLLLVLFFFYSSLPALEFCEKHQDELLLIRDVAVKSTLAAHYSGGKLFRNTYSATYMEAAEFSFKGRKNYSEYAAIFRDFLYVCQPPGRDFLNEGYNLVGECFFDLYSECIAKHSSINARYERSKIYYDRGLYEDCLEDIKGVVESGEWDKEIEVNDLALVEVRAKFEAGLYDNLITKLTELIEKDPSNKEALYTRALVCFEEGHFDQAIDDYIASGKPGRVAKVKLKTSPEFKAGVLKGLAKGAQESAMEFFPCLWSYTKGLGRALWMGVVGLSHPVASVENFVNACEPMGPIFAEYYENFDWKDVEDAAENKLRPFFETYNNLPDTERGEVMGYLVGKFGVDIFGGSTALKAATAFKRFKDANRLCNLETIVKSPANKTIIVESAVKHATNREKFFKNVKIEWDKQNKHVPNAHNYMEGKSIFEHPDAQRLLDKFAGKGQRVNNKLPGEPDYRERVNFGEFIGFHIHQRTGVKTETAWGEIRYSKKGAHIIPIKVVD